MFKALFQSNIDGDNHLWRNFLLRVSLVIILTGLVASVVILASSGNLVEQSLYLRAKAHFKDIILTRRWNSAYGGVFVEKKPGVESNPYLLDPDITTTDGKVYTKKNPALMTREISELALKDGDYQFHITSLKLKNPDNTPDPWERQSLEAFETGVKETITREKRGSQDLYRYMAPLFVESSCLACHADQGYKEGDIRGGISVSFDVAGIDAGLLNNRFIIFGLVGLVLLVVLGVIFSFVRILYHKLTSAQKLLKEMVILDDLTKINNRRFFFQALEQESSRARRYRNDLSCVMMDADSFKRINDTYGHQGGDQVLIRMAAVLQKNCRKSDIAARYGGEEFMILLPQTGMQAAREVAEKLRQEIEKEAISSEKGGIHVTASFGVAAFNPEEGDQAGESMLQRVDQALYLAKADGRNCVRG